MSADELKRSPDQDDPLFIAGYEFVERNIGSADFPSNIAWHGWMVRQAFWEGGRWSRDNEATKLPESEARADELEASVNILQSRNADLGQRLAASEASVHELEETVTALESERNELNRKLAAAEAIAEAEDESRDYEMMDLNRKLATAEARLNAPRIRGTLAIDTDHGLFEGLALQCIEPEVLAATVHRERQRRLMLTAKNAVLEEQLATARGLLREVIDSGGSTTSNWVWRAARAAGGCDE